MKWIDSVIAQIEEIETKLTTLLEKQQAKDAKRKAEVDNAISELDSISTELDSGQNLMLTQAAVLRSQIRLLKLQWARERIE